MDNDGDGRTDYDRDGDGFADALRDVNCVCENDPSEGTNPQCGDGCDNDNDGLIDLDDPGCDNVQDSNETNVPQCSDGIDNNNDGRIDYPNDPGCPNPMINIEETPDPLPDCADTIDNDSDTLADYSATSDGDDGCHSAADVDERPYCEHAVQEVPMDGKIEGSTRRAADMAQSTCSATPGGPEHIYRIDVPFPAKVTARIYDTNFSPNLYMRRACEVRSDEIQGTCRLFGNGSAGLLTLAQHDGELFLFVDGAVSVGMVYCCC